jgi:hypothetical protein
MTDPGDQGTPDEPYLARPDQPYDEPYLARPDQPYQPPPDQPYQPPPVSPYQPPKQPYQPPPDQPDQPPPVSPYQPPDQPDQPPPHQPDQPPQDETEKPRPSRRWWIIGAAVIVVAAGAAVALILAPTGGSSGSAPTGGSSDPDRYGQRVVDVIHELHIPCDNPEVKDDLASCWFPDGSTFTIVATAQDKADMDGLLATVKEFSDSECTVVVKGYLVNAPDRGTLTHAIGNPEAFAAKHHGHLLGCN